MFKKILQNRQENTVQWEGPWNAFGQQRSYCPLDCVVDLFCTFGHVPLLFNAPIHQALPAEAYLFMHLKNSFAIQAPHAVSSHEKCNKN